LRVRQLPYRTVVEASGILVSWQDISRDRGDINKTYDISYDDGESEMRVPEKDMIRPLGGTSSSLSSKPKI